MDKQSAEIVIRKSDGARLIDRLGVLSPDQPVEARYALRMALDDVQTQLIDRFSLPRKRVDFIKQLHIVLDDMGIEPMEWSDG